MADAAFASQPQNVAEPTKFGRASVRSANPSARLQPFLNSFANRFQVNENTAEVLENTTELVLFQSNINSGGLLGSGTGLLLAETRTAEANAPFAAPTVIGTALNSYRDAQMQIRENLQGKAGIDSAFLQISAVRSLAVSE